MRFSVLAHMSQPLECLIPNLRLQLQSLEKLRSNEQQVPHKLIELETLVQEIGSMLLKMKQAFTKPDVTQLILGKLTELLQQVRACRSPPLYNARCRQVCHDVVFVGTRSRFFH